MYVCMAEGASEIQHSEDDLRNNLKNNLLEYEGHVNTRIVTVLQLEDFES